MIRIEGMASIDNLREALQLACQAQHMSNIISGRNQIVALPRSWVLENIEKTAIETLDLGDDWEYRRLLEIADLLRDSGLVSRLVTFGQQSVNPDVREVAEEWAA